MAEGDAEPPTKKKRGPNRKIPEHLKELRAVRLRLLGEQVLRDKAAKGGKLPKGYYNDELLSKEGDKDLNERLMITYDDIRNTVRTQEAAAKKTNGTTNPKSRQRKLHLRQK